MLPKSKRNKIDLERKRLKKRKRKKEQKTRRKHQSSMKRPRRPELRNSRRRRRTIHKQLELDSVKENEKELQNKDASNGATGTNAKKEGESTEGNWHVGR